TKEIKIKVTGIEALEIVTLEDFSPKDANPEGFKPPQVEQTTFGYIEGVDQFQTGRAVVKGKWAHSGEEVELTDWANFEKLQGSLTLSAGSAADVSETPAAGRDYFRIKPLVAAMSGEVAAIITAGSVSPGVEAVPRAITVTTDRQQIDLVELMPLSGKIEGEGISREKTSAGEPAEEFLGTLGCVKGGKLGLPVAVRFGEGNPRMMAAENGEQLVKKGAVELLAASVAKIDFPEGVEGEDAASVSGMELEFKANGAANVTISLAADDSANFTEAPVPYAVNLTPAAGDVDLGSLKGRFVPVIKKGGDAFDMDVWVNTGDDGLRVFDVRVLYDRKVIRATGVENALAGAPQVVEQTFESKVDVDSDPATPTDATGMVNIFWRLEKGTPPKGLVKVATVRVIAEDKAADPTTILSGIAFAVTGDKGNIGLETPRPFIAGTGLVDPVGGDVDKSGAFDGNDVDLLARYVLEGFPDDDEVKKAAEFDYSPPTDIKDVIRAGQLIVSKYYFIEPSSKPVSDSEVKINVTLRDRFGKEVAQNVKVELEAGATKAEMVKEGSGFVLDVPVEPGQEKITIDVTLAVLDPYDGGELNRAVVTFPDMPTKFGAPCSSNDDCAPGEECGEGGYCEPKSCSSEADCDDENACTENGCVGGKCAFTAVEGCTPCKTGDECAKNESCEAGRCEPISCSSATECDDGDPCTADSCGVDGKCRSDAITDCTACGFGLPPCPDGKVCGEGGTCVAACENDTECDDGNACTADSCDSLTGCRYSAAIDGLACSVGGKPGKCEGGSCKAFETASCDDSTPCAPVACRAVECVGTPPDAWCDASKADLSADGQVCAEGKVCKDGECLAGSACASDADCAMPTPLCAGDIAKSCQACPTEKPIWDALLGNCIAEASCDGGRVIAGGICQCEAPLVWNGSACADAGDVKAYIEGARIEFTPAPSGFGLATMNTTFAGVTYSGDVVGIERWMKESAIEAAVRSADGAASYQRDSIAKSGSSEPAAVRLLLSREKMWEEGSRPDSEAAHGLKIWAFVTDAEGRPVLGADVKVTAGGVVASEPMEPNLTREGVYYYEILGEVLTPMPAGTELAVTATATAGGATATGASSLPLGTDAAAPVMAEGDVMLDLPRRTLYAGETLEVPVRVNVGSVSLASFKFDIDYDKDAFSFDEVIQGSGGKRFYPFGVNAGNEGKLVINGSLDSTSTAGTAPVDSDVQLMVISFTVRPDAAASASRSISGSVVDLKRTDNDATGSGREMKVFSRENDGRVVVEADKALGFAGYVNEQKWIDVTGVNPSAASAGSDLTVLVASAAERTLVDRTDEVIDGSPATRIEGAGFVLSDSRKRVELVSGTGGLFTIDRADSAMAPLPVA
ncbi:MAG TPA: cohesin domain-containing protein, partial [bacterium]|nr:cohesin domain-containing protein [bacterium]